MASQRPLAKPKKKGEASIREGAEVEGPGRARPEPAPASGEATAAVGHGRVDFASEWLFQQIERSGVLPPSLTAPEAAGAVLCTLSRRLSGADAQSLARSLPETLWSIVQRCAPPGDERDEPFGREQFLATLARHLQISADQAAAVACTVFAVIKGQLSGDVASRIEGGLPGDLREIWSPRAAA